MKMKIIIVVILFCVCCKNKSSSKEESTKVNFEKTIISTDFQIDSVRIYCYFFGIYNEISYEIHISDLPSNKLYLSKMGENNKVEYDTSFIHHNSLIFLNNLYNNIDNVYLKKCQRSLPVADYPTIQIFLYKDNNSKMYDITLNECNKFTNKFNQLINEVSEYEDKIDSIEFKTSN